MFLKEVALYFVNNLRRNQQEAAKNNTTLSDSNAFTFFIPQNTRREKRKIMDIHAFKNTYYDQSVGNS